MARGRSSGHRAAGRLPVSVDGSGEGPLERLAWRVLGASGQVLPVDNEVYRPLDSG